jgi:plastocyanin
MIRKNTIATIGLAASFLVASAPREALTQPVHIAAKLKTNAATQADIDRLEKKISDQQHVLERLVKLQQQYLMSIMGLIPEAGTATSPPPLAAEPEPRFESKPPSPEAKLEKALTKVEAKITAKPELKVQKIEPKKKGAGTIVGKVRGGAGDVFVYVEDVVVATQGSAAMKQEGKQFVPRVMAVQKGTRVEFPNRDAVFHNVFSVTPESSFDLGSYRQGETKGVAMTRPGVVNVYCNMHPQMVGYILVVPSSLYVRAGQDGFYRLPNVPSGKHRLVAWAPNAKPVVSEVDVADDEVVTIELDIKQGRALPHTNKDGMAYGSYKD